MLKHLKTNERKYIAEMLNEILEKFYENLLTMIVCFRQAGDGHLNNPVIYR